MGRPLLLRRRQGAPRQCAGPEGLEAADACACVRTRPPAVDDAHPRSALLVFPVEEPLLICISLKDAENQSTKINQ